MEYHVLNVERIKKSYLLLGFSFVDLLLDLSRHELGVQNLVLLSLLKSTLNLLLLTLTGRNACM